ncbi:MAG: extracellular solute-binding protein [Christensenellales bacterium]|jgi:putative aldouronate transport system substrate-binding protein
MKKLALILVFALLLGSVTAFADAFNPEGLPITDEKYTFSLMVDDSYTVEDHALIYDMLEAQTNVHVDLDLYPYQAALEKMNIALSTGDYPDVIAGWLLGTKDILDLGMGEGTFLPLEDAIEAYCPMIKQVLEIPGVRDSMTLPDGHIYSVPYVVSEPLVTFKPYINQRWLDNLGLAMPTTPEELKEVLIAFRDNDANGNGIADDEIPFSGDPNNLNLGMCAGWYGVDAVGNTDYPYFALVDGKLSFSANTDAYRQMLEFFADLYANNLIDPEIFTHDLETWKAKGNQDLYGVSIAYGPGDFIPNYEKNTPEYEQYGETQFQPLPVLKGCDAPLFHRNSYGVTLFRTQMAVTDNCDDTKKAIILRWFDNLFEEENSVQSQSGLLGVSIEKLDVGLYRELDKSEWTEEFETANSWGYLFTQSLPRWYHDAKVLPFGKDEVEPSYNDMCDALYEPYLNDTFVKVWATNEADVARSSILTTDINSYVKSMIAQFVSGETELNDDSWAAYCAQLESYGLAELTEINCRTLNVEAY